MEHIEVVRAQKKFDISKLRVTQFDSKYSRVIETKKET